MDGKFLYAGDEKLYVRGRDLRHVPPGADGSDYPEPEVVERDFAAMAANGINAVRTYTVPPRWLLDLALRARPRASWSACRGSSTSPSSTIATAPQRSRTECARACARARAIPRVLVLRRSATRSRRRSCAGTGARRIERFLERLYRAAKDEDPAALVTYVNYPSTEYLQLPFLDFVCFNVYLESSERLEAYLARLQNLAGDRPLLMAEIGLDSLRNGEAAQAQRARLAGAHGVRARLRGRVRLRLDRRVASRRLRRRRLGFRARPTATRSPSRRSRAVRGARSPRCRSRDDLRGRAISVVVCTLQRRAHDRATASTALARARLPGLRGDRRRRRLDRRHGRDRRASTTSA